MTLVPPIHSKGRLLLSYHHKNQYLDSLLEYMIVADACSELKYQDLHENPHEQSMEYFVISAL